MHLPAEPDSKHARTQRRNEENNDERTGLDVPDADRLVKRARHDQARLRVVVYTKDIIGVAFKSLHTFALQSGNKKERKRKTLVEYE